MSRLAPLLVRGSIDQEVQRVAISDGDYLAFESFAKRKMRPGEQH
jgi:hypothetical protein